MRMCVRARAPCVARTPPKKASAPRALQTRPSDINCDILGNVTLCLLLEALHLGRPCGMRGVKVSSVRETKKNQRGKCSPLAWLVGRHAQTPARRRRARPPRLRKRPVRPRDSDDSDNARCARQTRIPRRCHPPPPRAPASACRRSPSFYGIRVAPSFWGIRVTALRGVLWSRRDGRRATAVRAQPATGTSVPARP